jgi:hypothetical protein
VYKKAAGIQCVVKNIMKKPLNLDFLDLDCGATTGMGGHTLKPGVSVTPTGGDERGRLAPGATAILGQLFNLDVNGNKVKPETLTDAGRVCRCALKNREGSAWQQVSVEEQGQGALREKCKRIPDLSVDSEGMSRGLVDGNWAPKRARDCKKQRFHQPTNVAPDVESIKRAILHAGPVTASLDVFDDFQSLVAGTVYSKSAGAARAGGHALVLFGWGEGFWLGRNSWGSDWPRGITPSNGGEAGVFKIKMGSNEVGIEEKVMFSLPGELPRGAGTTTCDHVTTSGGTGGDGRACIKVTSSATQCKVRDRI